MRSTAGERNAIDEFGRIVLTHMTGCTLSNTLKGFIHASVKSIWALELLLFLRARRDAWWTVAVLARELRASEPVVRGGLGLFQAAGLIQEDPAARVRFDPTSAELDNCVREIAEIYSRRPADVCEEIYAPDRNLQHFVNAFRLKKG